MLVVSGCIPTLAPLLQENYLASCTNSLRRLFGSGSGSGLAKNSQQSDSNHSKRASKRAWQQGLYYPRGKGGQQEEADVKRSYSDVTDVEMANLVVVGDEK